MQRKLVVFLFGLVLLTVAIGANGQQKAEEEFISATGQFASCFPQIHRIMIP